MRFVPRVIEEVTRTIPDKAAHELSVPVHLSCHLFPNLL
jgi:hypothetical protein